MLAQTWKLTQYRILRQIFMFEYSILKFQIVKCGLVDCNVCRMERNGCLLGTYQLHHQGGRISQARNQNKQKPVDAIFYWSCYSTLNVCRRHIPQRRSQWPSILKHVLSSPTQTLWPLVRISLKAWMFVCVYSVFLLSCVGSGFATSWSTANGVLLTLSLINIL
jgi:hypothetical protein